MKDVYHPLDFDYLAELLDQKLQKEMRLLREEMVAYITAKREALRL